MSNKYTLDEIAYIINKAWESVRPQGELTPELNTPAKLHEHNKGFNRAKKLLKKELISLFSFPQFLENNKNQS